MIKDILKRAKKPLDKPKERNELAVALEERIPKLFGTTEGREFLELYKEWLQTGKNVFDCCKDDKAAYRLEGHRDFPRFIERVLINGEINK